MAHLPPDPYLALGVARDATQAIIKSSYKKLALKCHPDRVQDEALKPVKAKEFHKIQQAYDIIGDEDNRKKYDQEFRLAQLRKEKLEMTGKGPGGNAYRERSRPKNTNRAQRQRLDTLEGLRGFVDGKYVVALCDTGADENFIAGDAAKELGLEIEYLWDQGRPSFVMGHGRPISAIGRIKVRWMFEIASDGEYETTFYVLKDCIFDVMIGSRFLSKTETMTEHRYRLCRIPKPGRSLRTRVVNLCGTPSRRLRGSLKSEECEALPDSGAEPNLLSYEYVERRDWLLDMFPPPQSCRLLQFADGSVETVAGRLRLQWSFVKGWGVAPPDADDYVDFDVLRGCPFDVILGSDFLDDTDAFVTHKDSFQDVIQEGPSGLNIVIWVTDKKKKNNDRRDYAQDKVDLELERRAKAEWKATQRRDEELREQGFVKRDRERRGQWDADYPEKPVSYNSSANVRSTNTTQRPSQRRYPSPTRYPPTLYPSPTRYKYPQPPPPSPPPYAHTYVEPSSTNMRWTDTPHPSLAYKAKDRSRAAAPEIIYAEPRVHEPPRRPKPSSRLVDKPETRSHDITPKDRTRRVRVEPDIRYAQPNVSTWPHPSLPAKDRAHKVDPDINYAPPRVRNRPPTPALLVDELDMRTQNSLQNRAAFSSNRSDSSASTRSSRPRSYSDSSLSRTGTETSSSSISEDSIKHPSAQRVPTQVRTSETHPRVASYARKVVSTEDQPSSSSTSSVPAPSYGESNEASGRDRERAFERTGSNTTPGSRTNPSVDSTSRMSAEEAKREKPRLKRKTNFARASVWAD